MISPDCFLNEVDVRILREISAPLPKTCEALGTFFLLFLYKFGAFSASN